MLISTISPILDWLLEPKAIAFGVGVRVRFFRWNLDSPIVQSVIGRVRTYRIAWIVHGVKVDERTSYCVSILLLKNGQSQNELPVCTLRLFVE